jgi:hypothetical protein
MPALLCARSSPACCAVRGVLVVLGGMVPGSGIHRGGIAPNLRVEMLSQGAGEFVELPPLSCDAVCGTSAIAVDETHSTLGQMLLLGGHEDGGLLTATSSTRLVDMATGVCTPQADLLHARSHFAAARLPDLDIACAGDFRGLLTAEMWGRPMQGVLNAAWT